MRQLRFLISLILLSLFTTAKAQDAASMKAFVDRFYTEWGSENMLEYDYLKQHATPNLLRILADSYDYDCEGECLATWLFFYEGGGDVCCSNSRQIEVRDDQHVLVKIKYDNYEYDVLLKVIWDGNQYKIDGLQQERSEYISED